MNSANRLASDTLVSCHRDVDRVGEDKYIKQSNITVVVKMSNKQIRDVNKFGT